MTAADTPDRPSDTPDRLTGAHGLAGATRRWRLLGVRPPQCPFGTHRVGGSLDESARRLSHSELAVASQLVTEGHRVRAVPERRGAGRIEDLDVCGTPLEVKAWQPPAERGGRVPTGRSVYNKLVDARDQGTVTVLWARGSGLSALDAQAGVELFAGTGRPGSTTSVRILGDGFDLAWGRSPDLGVAAGAAAPEPHPSLGGDAATVVGAPRRSRRPSASLYLPAGSRAAAPRAPDLGM